MVMDFKHGFKSLSLWLWIIGLGHEFKVWGFGLQIIGLKFGFKSLERLWVKDLGLKVQGMRFVFEVNVELNQFKVCIQD